LGKRRKIHANKGQTKNLKQTKKYFFSTKVFDDTVFTSLGNSNTE
jgi:hypothetical protein